MGRNNQEICLKVIEIDKNNSLPGLRKILDLDSDFTENEDEYSDDTLELGYENEAERVMDELSKDDNFMNNMSLEEQVEAVINHRGNFILVNSTYCGGYITQLTQLEDSDTIVLSIAYHWGT